ncbi:DNA methyltransferase [Rothia sp. P7208]|uniref:DNA methyltransferase n=1 Tax=Rothia sp. P7208 TaxID=3402660 RepID=UPI003AD1E088
MRHTPNHFPNHGAHAPFRQSEWVAIPAHPRLILSAGSFRPIASENLGGQARATNRPTCIQLMTFCDPPYNTGNDGFGYNDRFNHSTWLVFMRSRLVLAKSLLKQDGVIFVQCDDNEQAYLKILMDEIFGRENFINNFIWKKRSTLVDRKRTSIQIRNMSWPMQKISTQMER